MFEVELIFAGLFALGFVAGYGVRALRSRRRRRHRVYLPPPVKLSPLKKAE